MWTLTVMGGPAAISTEAFGFCRNPSNTELGDVFLRTYIFFSLVTQKRRNFSRLEDKQVQRCVPIELT